MKKLHLILSFLITSVLFADTDSEIKPVSDSDFKVIARDGTALWLLEDIDKAIAKFDLTFDKIYEDSSNPKLDLFSYINDDIEVDSYRAWSSIYYITLKNSEFHLERNIRVGDNVESIYKKFQESELVETDEGMYIIHSSDDEESNYYFPVNMIFEIEDSVIEKIILMAFYD